MDKRGLVSCIKEMDSSSARVEGATNFSLPIGLVIFVDDLNGFIIKDDVAAAIIGIIISNPMDSLLV